MITYLLKVDDHHILQVNGKNVKVKDEPATQHILRSYVFNGVTVFSNYEVRVHREPFTTIVLAVELAREVMKQENKT